MMEHPGPERLARLGRDSAPEGLAPTTRRDLQYAWKSFESWCTADGYTPLPAAPDTLAEYLAARAPHVSMQTLRRVLRAVRQVHEEEGHDSPTETTFVQDVWRGLLALNKQDEPEEERRETVILEDELAPELRAMVTSQPDSPMGHRDRALLLMGAAGSLSRAELVGLQAEDVKLQGDGLELRVDHRGAVRIIEVRDTGDELGLRAALQAWLDESGIRGGPLFRSITRSGYVQEGPLSTQAVHVVLRRAAKLAGLADEAASTQMFAKSRGD